MNLSIDIKTIIFYSCFIICLLFLVPVASAQNITIDEISETSIVWNISELVSTANISTIAFDGVILEGYISGVNRVVQNNLYPSETHIITVIDDTNTQYELSATTLKSQQTNFLSFINQWSLIMFILIIFAIAILSEPMLGFIGVIIAFIGLTTTLNYSFELGSIFVILIVAGFFISVRGE